MILEEKLKKTEEDLTRQLSYTQQVTHIFNSPVLSCLYFLGQVTNTVHEYSLLIVDFQYKAMLTNSFFLVLPLFFCFSTFFFSPVCGECMYSGLVGNRYLAKITGVEVRQKNKSRQIFSKYSAYGQKPLYLQKLPNHDK